MRVLNSEEIQIFNPLGENFVQQQEGLHIAQENFVEDLGKLVEEYEEAKVDLLKTQVVPHYEPEKFQLRMTERGKPCRSEPKPVGNSSTRKRKTLVKKKKKNSEETSEDTEEQVVVRKSKRKKK